MAQYSCQFLFNQFNGSKVEMGEGEGEAGHKAPGDMVTLRKGWVCGRVYDVVNTSNDRMTGNDLEENGRCLIEALCRHLPGGTEEDHEKPQASRCPGRDLNRAPPEHKSRASPLHQCARESRMKCCLFH
jgi:hypothetical protein